jgi:hypothetical protein
MPLDLFLLVDGLLLGLFVVVAVAVVILRSITVFDGSRHYHTVEAFIDRNVATLIFRVWGPLSGTH